MILISDASPILIFQDGEPSDSKPPLIMKLTPPTPKKHICNGCGKEFSRSDVLRRHIREMHEAHESMINICPECGICIKRKHHLARHIKQVHSKGCECKACGEMFGNKIELKEHISTAHDGYNCEKCNRNYTSKSGLKFHIAQEHEQKYPCPICGKSSGSSSSFNKHLASHTEGSDIKCPHCRYIFPNKDSFMAHRESCRMSRAYTCKQCGKDFPSKNSFQHHEATHFDGKFPCHICGIKFSFSTNLNRHIRTVHIAKAIDGEDVKSPDSSIDKGSSDPSLNLSEAGMIAQGMEETHNNSLNQIVEAIKLQVERRISAGYCGNGEVPGKQSIGTDAMDTDDSPSPQKPVVSVSTNQLTRQIATSSKDPSIQVIHHSTPTKQTTGVSEFAIVSSESQKRQDSGNIWIALHESGKSASNIVLSQPSAIYQGEKPLAQSITTTENVQVTPNVGKKTVPVTLSETLNRAPSATAESAAPATYRIISDQLLLKSTTAPSVPTYRVITGNADRSSLAKTTATVLPNIYTVMTSDPSRGKVTSILPSTYVAAASEQVQMTVQKPQSIVMTANPEQASVPLSYAVQRPVVTSVQKVSSETRSDLVAHMQKILPDPYSAVPSSLLQKVDSGSYGIVAGENSPQVYDIATTEDSNKDLDVDMYNVVVKDMSQSDQASTVEVQEAGLQVAQNTEVSDAHSMESGAAFQAPVESVSEEVQFTPAMTGQVQEDVEYTTVTTEPDLITSNPEPAPTVYPTESGDNAPTEYTLAPQSLQSNEKTKENNSSYTATASENVENLMQLSDTSQMNLAVDNPSEIETTVDS